MKVERNKDEMSSCNNCLNRTTWAEVNININGSILKLCSTCRKELMIKLINEL
jgi:hypothetical protein